MLGAACAVGPSTRLDTGVRPVVVGADSAMPAATRALLDSLTTARAAEHTSPAAPNDSGRRLWSPARVALDTARDLRWLAVLRDPQLVALVTTAVDNNRDVRVARARVREYRALLGAARADYFPQITATAARGTNKSAFGSTVLRYNATQVLGNASYEFDVFGRVRRGVEAARFDLATQQEDARATTLTLVRDVAATYLQVRELDENLRVADQTVASRRATLDIARRRFQGGVTSELDVRTFEAELADPAARVADFTRQRAQLENQLAQLLGEAPRPIPRGLPLADAVQAITAPDSVPGALIADRPDVRAAARALQGATARVGVADANRLPAFSVTPQYGTQRPGYGGLFNRSGEVYALQGGVSVPLFDGGRLRSQALAARAQADEARGSYEQAVLAAQRDASDALAGVRLGRDQLAAQATQEEALRRAFGIAQSRYRSGISSYLEVLDAQRQLFAAQLALVQDERQYLVAAVDLYRALGGGWDGARR